MKKLKKVIRILSIFFFCVILVFLIKGIRNCHLKKKKDKFLTAGNKEEQYDRPIIELQIPNNKKPQIEEEQKLIEKEETIIKEDGCTYIWVIDVAYQPAVQEQGHYEIVHHEAVTRVIDIYQEFKTYYFVREDETYVTVNDYEGFLPEEYFNNLPEEFYRYYYKITKEVIGQEIVIDREAYDEKVWVVDQPYQPAVEEKGHYEKTGC